MADLHVHIAGVEFKNPVIAASGCFGFGKEYESFYPLERLGGISLKALSWEPREGNPPPRIAETASGILNSVGLQNPGVRKFAEKHLPELLTKNTVLIANVVGTKVEDYVRAAEFVSALAVDMIELNASCPNVEEGGATFGICPQSMAALVKAVRKVCQKPLIVKLTPNVTDIAEMAHIAEAEGADAISLINTLLGMRIDVNTERPILKNNTGGLSGPAIFPVALRMVWQVANAVRVPVIGVGGIEKWQDTAEMILAGAAAVQVGTAMFTSPMAPLEIIDGLDKWLDSKKYASVSDAVGKVEPW